MNRQDARVILEHLDVVRHFAGGGCVFFNSGRVQAYVCARRGKQTLLAGPLSAGFYSIPKQCECCEPKTVKCPTCGTVKRLITVECGEHCYD